ncbi:HAMP domain-containing protein [Breoghania sp.]|uniref:HAMP domain-containing protein n=1 Tax=Breoghania sp. TaxID=2065378 RepID=UPI0026287C72|nr:HAMP domain-containing protein [Breoghania sp.]MDJ0932471.1 HAMP domain-containing protein [Breoghania sp.]
MLLVGSAALIMVAGTAYAFYVFREALTSALGNPDQTAAFIGQGAAFHVDGLIFDQMQTIVLVCMPVGALFLVMAVTLALGVARPLTRLQNGLDRMSQGDFDVHIDGEGRTDEIGTIARSVIDFRTKLAECARMDAERQTADQRRVDEDRHQLMMDVAEDFERSVLSVVDALSNAAGRVDSNKDNLREAVTASGEAVTDVSGAFGDASAAVWMLSLSRRKNCWKPSPA